MLVPLKGLGSSGEVSSTPSRGSGGEGSKKSRSGSETVSATNNTNCKCVHDVKPLQVINSCNFTF